MGYTNYWKRTDKEYDNDFVELVKDVYADCKNKGITLGDNWGEGEPVADLLEIAFNGDASKDLDHETFYLPNTDNEYFKEGFNFCKTAAKPYDYAVKEVLRLAEKYGYVTDVSDDGEVDVISDAEYLGESYKTESKSLKEWNDWNIEAMTGYKPKTTFYMDFSIADRFGANAIKDTYNRAMKEWIDDIEYVTELYMVLNWKIWEHYEDNPEYGELYQSLWDKCEREISKHYRNDKEAMSYFYRTTD